jgi:hypothetical protein
MFRDSVVFAAVLLLLLVYSCGRPAEASENHLRARVLSALERQPVSKWDDESPKERRARLEFIADAIAGASRNAHEAAVLLTIGEVETHWAGYVGAGCDYPGGIPEGASTCDRGTSRSYWQMKESACREAWLLPRGSDRAMYAFAKCARERFNGAIKRCAGRHPGGDLAGGFAGYRSVDCAWEGREHDGARARARRFHRRLAQLM